MQKTESLRPVTWRARSILFNDLPPKGSSRQVAIMTLLALLSGCASITSSEIQTVSVSTRTAAGIPVEKANCSLKNDKGTWDTTSPSFVAIRRSAEDLVVECKKEGIADGFLRAISRAAGGMWGNVIFGGGIGALIDHNKGTGYDYPNELQVKMGEMVTVDKNQEQAAGTSQTVSTSNRY